METACCAPLGHEVLSAADAARLAAQFAALADPVRLQLLSLLTNADAGAICACDLVRRRSLLPNPAGVPICAGDLVEPVGKSQPTVSHHLKVLSEAGLVTSERRGRNIWYGAVPAALEALRHVLAPR